MKQFQQTLLKFQALSLRERLMAVAATLVVLFFLTDFALLGPQRNQTKALQKQITEQKVQLDALRQAMAAAAADTQPAAAMARALAERDDMRASVAQAESFTAQTASGAALGEVLQAMIGARAGLKLVSLKTLSPEVFYKSPPAATAGQANPGASKLPKSDGLKQSKPEELAQLKATAPQLTLYKHGVDVVVKGNYPALLAYLQSLQGNPNRMYWASVQLDATAYPEAALRMTIYTLSDSAESPLS